MKTKQLAGLEQFRAVAAFVAAHARHSHVGDATAPLAELRDDVDRTDTNAESQQEATTCRVPYRRPFRNHSCECPESI